MQQNGVGLRLQAREEKKPEQVEVGLQRRREHALRRLLEREKRHSRLARPEGLSVVEPLPLSEGKRLYFFCLLDLDGHNRSLLYTISRAFRLIDP